MITLEDKIRGCIAGSWVGSAMGAAVEGWTPERIRETYGFLQELKSYKHYTAYTDWQRPPGTTEDGIERQKLMNTAVIAKGDRITADDLVRVWVETLQPERMIYKQERFDRSLLEMAKAGVPPRELGRLWPFNNVVSMARASHTLGIINAGDPAGAAADVYDVGLVYSGEMTFALRWAALYDAAIAEALKPDATVESVLETARAFADYRSQKNTPYGGYDTVRQELERALEIASRYDDPMAMRDEFYSHYFGGRHFVYAMSQANEVVAKGLAIFAVTKGRTRDALLAAVNFGRDTDCLAAVAAGLAGALSGVDQMDPEWIRQVNEATKADPYTNSQRDIDETTEGLYAAVLNKLARERRYLDTMHSQPGYLD
ncbi:MAG: ADP-ribosylglycohydrolase family protein [Chloroflexi bacterium]|nr:ADP-ribosylglycohydrolase family protein [Chloroflexota bacterium]